MPLSHGQALIAAASGSSNAQSVPTSAMAAYLALKIPDLDVLLDFSLGVVSRYRQTAARFVLFIACSA